MRILDQILRNAIERRNGRIWTLPGNWVFEPTQAQLDRTTARNPCLPMKREDATGRTMYLIHQRGVQCPNPAIGRGKYPLSEKSTHWFVPWYVCKKCEYHQKGKRRGTPRYPCCKWRASEKPKAEAVNDVKNVMRGARKFADDIMGTGHVPQGREAV